MNSTPPRESLDRMLARALLILVVAAGQATSRADNASLEIAAVSVTPHVQAEGMRYRQDSDRSLGARVQIFLRNGASTELHLPSSLVAKFRGKTPEELVRDGKWAWYDMPSAWPGMELRLPPGALTVWQFNSRDAEWGVGTNASLAIEPAHGEPTDQFELPIGAPRAWISAATFLGEDASVYPNRLVLHVDNETGGALRLKSCRLWLPESNASWRSLRPGPLLPISEAFPAGRTIPPSDKGGAVVHVDRLPLTYVAIELSCTDGSGAERSLWTHLRIKRETFDISGGWVASAIGNRNSLEAEPFLKTLQRMHVNTAHIAETPGYTDQDLYTRFPLKYFNKLEPVERYDTDAVLPRIHAVEFLGEPQYGGGRPVPPMEVWRKLAPYQRTRLPTSVTHSEERIWLLTAFRNGGAGQPKMVALGVEDSLVKDSWCVAEGAWFLSADFGSSSAFGVLEPVALSLGLQDVAAVRQAVQCRPRQPFAA